MCTHIYLSICVHAHTVSKQYPALKVPVLKEKYSILIIQTNLCLKHIIIIL